MPIKPYSGGPPSARHHTRVTAKRWPTARRAMPETYRGAKHIGDPRWPDSIRMQRQRMFQLSPIDATHT
eukprot:8280194-Pyramimonas_sp.AAC.1